MTAARNHAALSRACRNPHEHGLEAERADPKTDFVVLRQSRPREWLAGLQCGQLSERPPRDGAADSGERNRSADRFAYDQLLDVRLRELVAIMATDPARVRILQREYRQLDDGRAIDQPVEYSELVRMHHVFRVVHDDRLRGAAGLQFVCDQ